MKKLGLCVVIYNNNFGSMLQSYATQKKLENMGIEYEVIRYRKKYTPLFFIKSFFRIFNPIMLSEKKILIQKKVNLSIHKDISKYNALRNKKFDEFRKIYFQKLSPIYFGYSELLKAGKKYDAYLVGSDQLWSPSGLPSNFYNLKFVDDKITKISYASSFGVKKIPFYQIKRTEEYLKRIEYIGVRENTGKNIVKELTGRDVQVVVDPTLLFNDKEWKSILEYKSLYTEPYIFAYFLGPNEKHRMIVNQLKKSTGLKIVTIRHMDEYVDADEKFGDYAPYNVGPVEFVSLISHAQYICTDSFHGTVFSILHHKQFITFNRYSDNAIDSKNSRIDSLCSNLGLEDRRFKNNIEKEMLADIDYTSVDIKLEDMRKKSNSYLEKALTCMGE
ncbi:polysaccharide pyruvyl transferase family protein [Clostridium arbusti]|uniref:polysaccharide pyruvyl transferase family protein n=1 Tax=Clostridium arbusti TaxID=1137848 RepID=UPI000289DB4D|nr:polysaccharide pyruvyl transferase family protein [Clostridium arbusti]